MRRFDHGLDIIIMSRRASCGWGCRSWRAGRGSPGWAGWAGAHGLSPGPRSTSSPVKGSMLNAVLCTGWHIIVDFGSSTQRISIKYFYFRCILNIVGFRSEVQIVRAFLDMRYAATTVAERDQPITQFTTTVPRRDTASSMNSFVRVKNLR